VKKTAQNVAQAIFCQNQCITIKVEINSPKVWPTFLIFKTSAQRKQSPNERKFAQSGHPAWKSNSVIFPREIREKKGQFFS
jgi:hypothetical protein